MSHKLPVFISSRIKELFDIRNGVEGFLKEFGLNPFLSNDSGFPNHSNYPPHISCLKVLEDCPLIIGIIDKSLGCSIEDWGSYSKYNNFCPTQAEIVHSLNLNKKILIFIRDTTMQYYDDFSNNIERYNDISSKNMPEVAVISFINQLMKMENPPWIRKFSSITDLNSSLKENIINELYTSFKEIEKEEKDKVDFILNKIFEAAPEVRKEIESKINPKLSENISSLKDEIRVIKEAKSQSEKETEYLKIKKSSLELDLIKAKEQLEQAKIKLTLSALKDFSWLETIKKTLMPKQEGRVPFHNDEEVSMHGYHCSNMRNYKIELIKVTWSKLQYIENNLHRGYYAGIIFYGKNIPPGTTYASRIINTNNEKLFWRLPNIYFRDYLEVSTNEDEIESPLAWINHEFCIKTPEGELSNWIKFSFDFDNKKIINEFNIQKNSGLALFDKGEYAASIEYLRRSYTIGKNFPEIPDEEANSLSIKHQEAIKLSKELLKYDIGMKLEVIK